MTDEATLPGTDPGRVDEPRAFSGRFADRLNPVLVREVQQALNSRGFAIVLTLALVGVVLVAMGAVGMTADRQRAGAAALLSTLYVLVPLLFVVVPLQAFIATRQEVAAGTVEHLLLSRLTPGAIVRGKLLAAAVQFVLYLAVFAPLIALTYQLRGVDVVTIASVLLLTFVLGLAACGYGVAGGACCRIPQIQALAFLLVIGGLAVLTMVFLTGVSVAMAFGGFRGVLTDRPFSFVLRTSALVGAGLWLFSLVGSSTLAHPYENRSSGFRAFGLLLVLGLPLWAIWMATASGSGALGSAAARSHADEVAGVVGVLAIATLPFWLFAVTEESALSPRARITVPRNPVLALLSAPFLPGCGRGFLFTLLLTLVAGATALLVPRLVLDVRPDPDTRTALLAWGYAVFFAGVGAFVRRLLGRGPARNWLARAIVILVFVVAIVGMLIVDVATRGRVGQWHPGHLLNPFFSLEEAPSGALARPLLALVVAVVALNLPAMVRGVAEVLAASRERRRRAA